MTLSEILEELCAHCFLHTADSTQSIKLVLPRAVLEDISKTFRSEFVTADSPHINTISKYHTHLGVIDLFPEEDVQVVQVTK